MITEQKKPNKLDLARSLALGVSLAGALASLLLTLQTGRKGSALLVILFYFPILFYLKLSLNFNTETRRNHGAH